MPQQSLYHTSAPCRPCTVHIQALYAYESICLLICVFISVSTNVISASPSVARWILRDPQMQPLATNPFRLVLPPHPCSPIQPHPQGCHCKIYQHIHMLYGPGPSGLSTCLISGPCLPCPMCSEVPT